MRSLFETPCRIVAGVKEAGAAAFLANLLEGAHVNSIVHVFAHRAAAQVLEHQPGLVQVADDVDLSAESLLNTYEPDLVVVGASTGWSIEKSLTKTAKLAGVPVFAFIDNYMNIWQRFAHEVTAQRWVYLPDRIYAISREMVERLQVEGCPPDVITLTRHPVLEQLGTLAPSCLAAEFKKNLGIEEAQIVLTLAVETGIPNSDLWRWDNLAEEVDPAIESLLKTLLDFALAGQEQEPGRAVVLIKHHPSDGASFSRILNNYPSHIYRIIFKVDKLALLDVSTAVFGIGSMLLFEAAARNRQTYSVDLPGKGTYPSSTSVSNVKLLTSLEDLRFELHRLGATDRLESVVR